MFPYEPVSPRATALVSLVSISAAPGTSSAASPPLPKRSASHGQWLKVDPSQIRPSSRRMRSALSFDTPEFSLLKQDISVCGGNLEPILVRLLSAVSDLPCYEVITGHRRLEACEQLKIDVFVLVIAVSDCDAARTMAKSNTLHVKPSPYELGRAYLELLQDKVYLTQKELARHLGANESEVTNAQILACLAPRVQQAFASVLNLRYSDARPLRDAWAAEKGAVEQRIDEVRSYPAGTFTHAQTVDIVLGLRPAEPDDEPGRAYKIPIFVEQVLVATIRASSSGRTVIELAQKNWPLHRLIALVPGLEALLGGTVLVPGAESPDSGVNLGEAA